MFGSPRLVWFNTFVNVPSAFSLNRSVIKNVLLSPDDRLNKPGPSTEPTSLFPKRPIGRGTGPVPEPVVHGLPTVQLGSPGQANAAAFVQFRRFLPAGLTLTPVN